MLTVGYKEGELRALFEHVEPASAISCEYCMPELTATPVYLCRGPRRPLAEIWSTLEDYVTRTAPRRAHACGSDFLRWAVSPRINSGAAASAWKPE